MKIRESGWWNSLRVLLVGEWSNFISATREEIRGESYSSSRDSRQTQGAQWLHQLSAPHLFDLCIWISTNLGSMLLRFLATAVRAYQQMIDNSLPLRESTRFSGSSEDMELVTTRLEF